MDAICSAIVVVMQVDTLRCRFGSLLNAQACVIAGFIHCATRMHHGWCRMGFRCMSFKEILGHTDIKTTLRYAHLEQQQVTSRARDVINRLNLKSGRLVLDQKPT